MIVYWYYDIDKSILFPKYIMPEKQNIIKFKEE